jgi:hypothetical protein
LTNWPLLSRGVQAARPGGSVDLSPAAGSPTCTPVGAFLPHLKLPKLPLAWAALRGLTHGQIAVRSLEPAQGDSPGQIARAVRWLGLNSETAQDRLGLISRRCFSGRPAPEDSRLAELEALFGFVHEPQVPSMITSMLMKTGGDKGQQAHELGSLSQSKAQVARWWSSRRLWWVCPVRSRGEP